MKSIGRQNYGGKLDFMLLFTVDGKKLFNYPNENIEEQRNPIEQHSMQQNHISERKPILLKG